MLRHPREELHHPSGACPSTHSLQAPEVGTSHTETSTELTAAPPQDTHTCSLMHTHIHIHTHLHVHTRVLSYTTISRAGKGESGMEGSCPAGVQLGIRGSTFMNGCPHCFLHARDGATTSSSSRGPLGNALPGPLPAEPPTPVCGGPTQTLRVQLRLEQADPNGDTVLWLSTGQAM